MRSADVIVVGAGAAGLMIARELSREGKSVIILEARDRTGGRIHTIEDPAFVRPVEAGAEFIHGRLPVTLGLLKEAGIGYCISGGDSWQSYNGALVKDEDGFMGEDDRLSTKLRELKEDMTVAVFLETYFSGEEDNDLRQSIKGFVEGYDAADSNRASAFTLRKEMQEMEEGEQYRIDGGYVSLVRFLEKEILKNGSHISLSTIVKEISWKPGLVDVTTGNDNRYTSKKIILTVPLGVLCADNQAKATITFSPSLTDKENSFKALGYGGVIKILLLFRQPFWKDRQSADGKSLKEMGWLFSGESIPTWWSQAPDESALLAGWLAGPKAQQFKDADDSILLQEAMESLCTIFKMGTAELSEMLVHSRIENWLADPFSLGAYSYATPQSGEAIKQLSLPIENTVFFAGEALYDGPEIGTVEAALANGLQVAGAVLDSF